jgi:FkbM family methyltransferase
MQISSKWRTSILKRVRRMQRALGTNVITCSYFGAKLSVDMRDLVGYEIAINRFEHRNLERFAETCRSLHPDLMIDVGANIGLYSCVIGANGFADRIIAFEPNPDNYSDLCANIERNGLTAISATHQKAVGDKSDHVRMTARDGTNFGLCAVSENGTHVAEMVALDNMISVVGKSIAIKIDVEDHEPFVLNGAKQLLSRNFGFAQIEARDEGALEVVTELMRSFGWAMIDRHALDAMYERR